MKNLQNRIVHLDLKGAPWKVPYLISVIRMAKHWGATGILFEWEDSFPFSGELTSIGSLRDSSQDGLYTKDEIIQLLQYTKDQGLEPIQLVQSLAHMEYVLKHDQFAHYREVDYSPFMICPTRLDARALVTAMVKQALDMQPDATYIHIGADEACHMNQCAECQAKSNSSEYGSDFLFIDHIKRIVLDVRKDYSNVKFLIWDDMMRNMDENSLIVFGLHECIIPVVWNYGPVGGITFVPEMWRKYNRCFLQVWVASAYKGANGASQVLSPVERYVSNQEAWMQEICDVESSPVGDKSLAVSGLILTGWSRYDHYATLCELLPASLPSLASCLKMWIKPQYTDKSSVVSELLPSSEWPGEECALAIRKFYECREHSNAFLHGDHLATWMNSWQVANNYSNPMQLRPIAHKAKFLYLELSIIRTEMSSLLSALTGRRSTHEWIHTFIDSISNSLLKVATTAEERCQLPAGVSPLLTNQSDKNSTCS